jgi:chromosome segregation ATPase
MYLKRLELQGFKTFAQKMGLEFVLDASGRRGVTAVVGPNGSGKSNVADGLRWVMGEQSMKLLRGKRSEDVIFAGSEKRSRSGFCEVTMILENDDKPELGMSEIAVTRRLYRDGQSEYEINRQAARLQDMQLLLAQCGIGQRTYSVIGQGMVDQVLVAGPAERKEFFDEAFGLKPFQLKRNSAWNKISASKDHLAQTDLLLQELGPRLASLEKQVKRLQEREGVEQELRSLERQHYGRQWAEIRRGWQEAAKKMDVSKQEIEAREKEAMALQQELEKMEKDVPVNEGFQEIRKKLDELNRERGQVREEQLKLDTKRAVAAVRAEKPWSPLPLSKIIEGIEEVRAKYQALSTAVQAAEPDLKLIRQLVNELQTVGDGLVGKLQRPAPEPEQASAANPEIEAEATALAQVHEVLTERVRACERELDAWNQRDRDQRSHLFELQRRLTTKRQEVHGVERTASDAAVELARFETRREGFLQDLRVQAPALEAELETLAESAVANQTAPDTGSRLQRLRSQLEWIGGIDPEVMKEHGETKERHSFLSAQAEDVRAGLAALETVVEELDRTIQERSKTAFTDLNREFGKFFKTLFGGGDAKLIEVQSEPEVDEQGNALAEDEETAERIVGIDIQVTPPGKTFKSISLLSGGERALTSIALICAIMATNPSPFVVLDEVDAALDESNSKKFAEIVASLADKTQFVVITHNRATMAQANVLYGVTMGGDGVSQLLSVKLEDIEKLKEQGAAR